MKTAGPRTWKKLRDEVHKLPCETCREHGALMIDGIQDVTNANQLDRPLHDVTRFTMFKAEVDKAAEKSGLLVHSSEPSNNELMLGIGLGVAGLIVAFIFR
jgi:uncharacterized protein YjeT (DUF2065 family)